MTVSLRGQGLGDITGGAAVSGRMSSPDVQVALGTVGLRGTSRPVTLTAAAGAGTAELDLRFTLRTRIAITAPVGVSVVALQVAPPPTRTFTPEPPEPTIDSATPGVLDVYPGASATVQVSGNNLSGYQTASVLLNGRSVSGISATVTSTGTTSLEIRIDAALSVEDAISSGVFSTAPELVLPGPPNLTVPVTIPVRSALERLQVADWAAVVTGVLQGASFSFNSCGPSNADRTFTVGLPAASYVSEGTVPRLEYGMNFDERMAFLELHSLEPFDREDVGFSLGSLTSTEHPTSVSHTVTRVRMCLGNLTAFNPWEASEFQRGPSGIATGYIEWHFPNVLFVGRGMPADPTGNIDGENVGILWGSDIVNTEIPDRTQGLRVLTSLEFSLESGTVSYALRNRVIESTGRWVPGPARRGTSMPASVELSLERFANDRIRQIETEIVRAMAAPAVREAFSAAVLARLGL